MIADAHQPDPIDLAASGLHVFAISAGQKRAEPGWQTRCTTDPDEIATWSYDTNVGIGCRASNIVVLDLDQHHPDADGVAAFAALFQQHEHPPIHTLTVRTPNGRHVYFRAPADRAIPSGIGRIAPGIDVRAPGNRLGGYVVGPGSVVGGREYVIELDAPIAPLPDWLADLVANPARAVPAHLIPEVTSRGFHHMPPLAGTYGGTVRLSESSAAAGPHAWLRIAGPKGREFPGDGEGVIHLTLDTLRQFRDQADWLLANHYQLGGR